MTTLVHQLTVSHEQCARLRRLLDEEFEALRGRNLELFESLQPPKASLLADLVAAVERHQRELIGSPADPSLLASWDSFRAAMLECRDLHRRNELLILRKRDAIEGALQALVGGCEPTASVDIYDRMGRVNRLTRKNAYAQA